ncbi:hypothetical protein HP456_12590, partial [Bacillus haikouensis]|nr:hypothetical protein [Bacillus haikouensis]
INIEILLISIKEIPPETDNLAVQHDILAGMAIYLATLYHNFADNPNILAKININSAI